MAASNESNVDSDFEDRMEVAFADDEISANVDEDVSEAVDDVKVFVSTILDEIISKVVCDEVVDSASDAENVHDCKCTFILAYFFVHFKTSSFSFEIQYTFPWMAVHSQLLHSELLTV